MTRIAMMEQSDGRRRDFETEALRIVEAASGKGIMLRLLGSLAFQLHCPGYGRLQKQLGRAYTDIDFAGYRTQAFPMRSLLGSLGYEEDHEVNILYAGQRMIYHSSRNGLHVDIFFDQLNFCHEVNWVGRLENDYPTIPLAEMLLEKMQIVKINDKDVIDTLMLLLEHPLGDGDDETINTGLIAGLCARNWGLWRTITMNLRKVAQLAHDYPQLAAEEKQRIQEQVHACLRTIDDRPKTAGWKIRSMIGDSVKWYQEVDEIQ